MKTNKTEEKKCEACKAVPHNGHNTDMYCCRHTCQKEQPSIDTVFICQKCRNKKDRWKPGAIVPYCVCEETTPPQELRQEAVINPFVGNIAELHKAIELLETMIPSDERKNLAKMYYTTATEMIEANRIQAYMEKIKQLQNMLDDASDEIKNVEQKARDDERKRCAETIKRIGNGCRFSNYCKALNEVAEEGAQQILNPKSHHE